jgi:hypothetical protein
MIASLSVQEVVEAVVVRSADAAAELARKRGSVPARNGGCVPHIGQFPDRFAGTNRDEVLESIITASSGYRSCCTRPV